MSMLDKDEVIISITEQMRQHHITLGEIERALQSGDGKPSRLSDTATRLLSILGGIFIFAGFSVYIGMFWTQMNTPMHILVTLGVGIALHAVAIAMMESEHYRKAVKPLLLIACVAQTGGWGVVLNEFHPDINPRYAVLFIAGIMGVQELALFAKYRLTILLFGVIGFGYAFAFTMLDLVHAGERLSMIGMGISMIAIAQSLRPTRHAILSGIGYFCGGGLFFSGLFDWVRGTTLELGYLAAACAVIYISTWVRSSALLTVSTLAMLCYIGYFTSEHFVNSIGWPLSLVLLGIALFAVSGLSLRLKRRYIS